MALVISCAPPIDPGAGFWARWAYNVMQLVGASADKFITNNPYIPAKLQQTVDKKTVTPLGDTVSEHSITNIQTDK